MSVKPGFDAMFQHVVEGRTNETIAVHTGLIHVFSNQKPTGHWSKKPHGRADANSYCACADTLSYFLILSLGIFMKR